MNDQNHQPSGIPIYLNKKEYRALIRILFKHILMFSNLTDQQTSKEFERINSMAERLLKYANDFASEDLVAHDVSTGTNFPSNELYREIITQINAYDEVNFWEELTQRLSERDLVKGRSFEELNESGMENHRQILEDRLVFYTDHFGEHGVENLYIINDPHHSD
ncbi:MAG: hypothetical protein HLUCCA01_01065 [Bacteroidetes bacterium HLUCCA01]|nr:MAG: hypothetical protein HLUCCA01_01065 [Bacteroidetes bacterium HLUCCA01]